MSNNIQIILPTGEVIIAQALMGSVVLAEPEQDESFTISTIISGTMNTKMSVLMHRDVTEHGLEFVKERIEEMAEENDAEPESILTSIIADIISDDMIREGVKSDEEVRQEMLQGNDDGCQCSRCVSIRNDIQSNK